MRRLWVIGLWLLTGCGGSSTPPGDSGDDMRRSVAAVIEEVAPQWMKTEGVHGVYESLTEDHDPCVKVMVTELTPAIREAIPEIVFGYPVFFRETGPLAPRGSE
ncbi:MAG: hypothetical protein DHS20C21_24580 [Gemmatimonadota bacterium]|nr:MAG: hypothetical protein DHS20C21_24580 [Gemmatimonadota bacterium]